MFLVRSTSAQLTSVQGQIWRSTGIRIKSAELKNPDAVLPPLEPYTAHGVNAGLAVIQTLGKEIDGIEQRLFQVVNRSEDHQLLQSIRGVGKILALIILLEAGDIRRFPSAGQFASYCRCVQNERQCNGKKKGSGDAKAGNKYLSWTFSEAAYFAVQWDASAKHFYECKQRKTNRTSTIRAVARILARANWMMLKQHTSYDEQMLFG